MSEFRWGAYDSIATYETTDLNALANDALVLGAAIDFTAGGVDRKHLMDIELYLASVDLSAQTNPAAYIWIIARTDGTNFEDAAVTPARPPDDIIPLRVVNGAQRVFARGLKTTPDQGKILIKNEAGAAWAATGNTLKYYIYGDESI